MSSLPGPQSGDPFSTLMGSRRGPDGTIAEGATELSLHDTDTFAEFLSGREGRSERMQAQRLDAGVMLLRAGGEPLALLQKGELRVRSDELDGERAFIRDRLRDAARERGIGAQVTDIEELRSLLARYA